jgi:hypothetical protein
MRTIPEHFDFLFTTDCRCNPPRIERDVLRIYVKNLGLIEGHPARTNPGKNLIYVPSCHFTCIQVGFSVGTVWPSFGDPKLGKFGQRHVEPDGPSLKGPVLRNTGSRGFWKIPWINWEVVAAGFTLEIA